MTKKTEKKTRLDAEKPDEVAYRDCVVTFIDILGFKNIVGKRSPKDIQQIIDLVQRHAGSNDKVFAQEYDFDISEGIPWTRTVLFSDSVVRVRPYDEMISDGSLFHEILDLVHAQAELAYQGIFIRGGLTVGKLYHRDNVLFGPAMIQAYDLESKFANYPRIVIDPLAVAALKTDERLRKEGHTLDDEQNYVSKLLQLGEDGLYYIDYLGAFRVEMDDYDTYPAFLTQVKQHIIDNAVAAQGSLGVLHKYLWSAQYLNAVAKRFTDCNEKIQISESDILGLARVEKNWNKLKPKSRD